MECFVKKSVTSEGVATGTAEVLVLGTEGVAAKVDGVLSTVDSFLRFFFFSFFDSSIAGSPSSGFSSASRFRFFFFFSFSDVGAKRV